MPPVTQVRRIGTLRGALVCLFIASVGFLSGFNSLHVAVGTLTFSLSLGCASVTTRDYADWGVHVLPHVFVVEWLPAWEHGLIVPLWMAFAPVAVGTASLFIAARLRSRPSVG